MCITSFRSKGPGTHRHNLKSLTGRGRKREPWVLELHSELYEEFRRLRAAGIKVDTELLRVQAIELLDDPEVTLTRDRVEQATGRNAEDCISRDWIIRFQKFYNMRNQKQNGKKRLSPEVVQKMNREVACFLGKLQGGYQ